MSLTLTRGRGAVPICAYLCDTCGAESPGRITWEQVRATAEPLGWMTLPTGARPTLRGVRHECPNCAQPTLFSEAGVPRQ